MRLNRLFPDIRKMRLPYHIILLSCSIVLVSCLSWIWEQPSFAVREIIISPRSLTEMHLFVGVDIQNPNRFELKIQSMEYTVHLNRVEIGKGNVKEEVLVPPLSNTRVKIPVDAKFKDWHESMRSIIHHHNLPYKIEGSAQIKTVFGSVKMPFSKDGNINLRN